MTETCSGSSFFCASLSRCWSAVSHLVCNHMISFVIMLRIIKVISIIMTNVISPEVTMTMRKYMNIGWWRWCWFSPFCDVLNRLVEVEELEQNSPSFEEQDFLRSLFVEHFLKSLFFEGFLKSGSSSSYKILSAHDHNSYFKALLWI